MLTKGERSTLNPQPSWVSDDKDVKDVTTSVAWGDLDCDGNLELMAGSQLGLKIYHIDVDKNGHLITRAAKEKEHSR